MRYLRPINRISAVALACAGICLAACATLPPAAVQERFNAASVPYRISQAGHFIIDVSINGDTALPFIIDSGATVSVLYADTAETAGLIADSNEIFVAGLIAIGQRKTVSNVTVTVGDKSVDLDRIAILETSNTPNGAAGLLGTDFLSDYSVLFNRDAKEASFIDGETIDRSAFSGWSRIALQTRLRGYDDLGLYFAQTKLENIEAPVLIDIGSDTNFVNWSLAEMDNEIRRLRRRLDRAVKLEGAVGTTKIRMQTQFHEVDLGLQRWSDIPIVIMDFDTLADVAPVESPMMVAGAGMFSDRTFAFDFAGNAIYIYPEKARGNAVIKPDT